MSADYFVSHVPQTQQMSCWAASTAMMIGYRDNQCYPEEAVLQQFAEFGIDGADNEECKKLASVLGLNVLPDQCSTAAAWDQMLQNGPIMVGTPTHVIVVAGVSGEDVDDTAQLKVHDPAQDGEYWGAYQAIEQGYETNPEHGYTVNLFQW
jgi:ABC-type bacteriocin/lantibiotic exporter with double-glycine peptidase domain